MAVTLFDTLLTTPDMIAVFDDASIIDAMLRFEAELATAQAAEGLIPVTAAERIAAASRVGNYDIPALITAGRGATLAIPLVKALTQAVARRDPDAATHVHWGSTSQDVMDTALVLVTRDALRLLDTQLGSLCRHLEQLAAQHLATPLLARTLLQPAQVTGFGFKVAGWLAPLVRARGRLRAASVDALQLQLGGAVGTLAVMGDAGPKVAERIAYSLGLKAPLVAWHTQRDEWVRLGLEVALLNGSLGKLATDLALMAQGEIGELAEPSGNGRGGSSAMPHKRNPVSSMISLAAATRSPQHAASLLAAMGQQHERGLGNWQAELAEWPALFLAAHGALRALDDAFAGLTVDARRMRANIDALGGLVFAEAVTIWLAGAIGRPGAHAAVERMSREAVAQGRHLRELAHDFLAADPALQAKLDPARLDALFDPVAATEPAQRLARRQLDQLRAAMAALDATPAPTTSARSERA